MKWLRLLALRIANREWEELQRGLRAAMALEDERRARASLEVSSASLIRENHFLRQESQEARRGEREALRLLCNLGIQRLFGVKPYPDAKGLPEFEQEKSEQPGPSRVQGIDMVRTAREQFMSELRKRKESGEILPVDESVLEQALGAL
jgi:hypothetical protein